MAWKGKKPTEFALQIKADAEKRMQDICLDLTQGVITGTPVDQGTARGNWIASNKPDFTSNPDTRDVSGQGAIQKCYVFFSQNAKLGSVLYLQNNLPYIKRLEEGWSQQAPHGMVATTMNLIKQKYGG